jgi:hypothetical protein
MQLPAELVRRVVETRRTAANGGADSISRTAALSPAKEKDGTLEQTDDANEQEKFWKKLKCW